MDADDDLATGCLVQGMAGVDQVLTTEALTDDAAARVTRTTLSVCSGGLQGPEVELTSEGWPVGYQPASGATLVETSMPFSLFPGGVVPAQMRLGLAATQGAASHVALTLPDGSRVIYPPAARGRRRVVAAPGAARMILLDGEGADWNGLDALFDGIAGTGSPALRMVKFYAFSDEQTDTLFFRFDANLSSDAPFATDDLFSRVAGQALTVIAPGVLANDGDPNDLPLTALPVTPAAHGSVVLNPDGSFTYTPVDASSTQTDAFEYRASNGTKNSNPARVEITVSTTGPVAPVASDDAWTTSEDEALVIAAPGVLANDSDANDDPLSATLATPPSHGTVILHADGGFTYAPQSNYFGSDTFTYTVSDGSATDTAQVTITIVGVNDEPVVASQHFDLPENSASGTVVGTVGVTDPDSGDSHSFMIISGNVDDAFAIAANGTLSVINPAAIDFETHPQFVLSVRAKDDGTPPLSDTGNVTVTILDANDIPVAAGQAVATNEDTPVAITLSASDEDSDPLTWSIAAAPAHGALSGAAPHLTYTPDANYFGLDSFTFRANDGTADSALATVQITIAGVNDVPVAAADAFVVDEAGSVDGNVLANDSDIEGPLTALLDTNVSHGTLTFNTDGTFSYVHDGSETASDSFTYHATDGVANSAIVTVTITVNPVNDAPVNTVPGDQVTTEDLTVSFTGATALSIADADAGAAVVEVTLAAANGTITLGGTAGLAFSDGANGTATMTFQGTIADINLALASLDFAPTPNFSGIATLSITTNDLGNTPAPAATDSDVITITVTAENDAPVATDDTYSVDEGGTLNEAAPGVLGNDTDVDSTITAVLVNDVANGTLTLNADGSFDYTHDGSETTSDSFTYRATDGTADSSEVTVTITINPVNDLPVFTSSDAVSVPENGTAVLTVTTTDAEGDVPSYAIGGGADAARFAINAATGALSFASAPDFEAPADADGNNIYLVEVAANDGTGDATQTIAVTVTGVDEAPVASDATFAIDENSANGTAVGSVTAVDPDAGETLTYAITAGNAGGAFAIDASTGAITVANISALDFEVTPIFNLTVSVTDDSAGLLSDSAAITINLNDVNEAPVVDPATVALDENSANGTAVHTVTFSEPDATGQTHTFAITAGNDSGAFGIDANSGAITVASVAALDFETTASFALTVEVTDVGAPTPNLAGTATITINLNDLNENPVVDDQSFSVDENSANGTVVGAVVATDQDAGQTLTFAITAGNTGGAFAIDANSGQITVADTGVLDFETNPTFTLTVEVTDNGGLTDTAFVTINLQNLNEAPAITPQAAATLAENAANGTSVLTVVASDPDAGQTLTYAITGGNTGGAFAIDANSGAVTVATSAAVDFEANPTFTLTILVSDDGTPSANDSEAFVINLTDANEAPVVDAHTFSLPENSPNGTAVGTATFTDQDLGQAHTFAITAGNDLGAFAIDANSGAITVADVTDLDFETNPSFSLTVEVTDNLGLTGSNTVTINLTDANEAPIVDDQSFNVDENSALGTVVGSIAFTDSDGPGATFSITAGNAGGEFAVNPATGEITVAKLLNYEVTSTSFVFTIQIADGGTPAGSDTAQITIDVNDVNEAPVVDAASATIAENSANATSVTTVTFTDPDAGQAHTFAIDAGNTGGAFGIDAATGEITVANSAALDFETTTSFSLTISVTDDGTPVASGTNLVTITVTNQNDAPTDIALSNASIAETAPSGTAVGTLTTIDEDTADSHVYTFAAGAGDTDNASFTIAGDQLVTATALNFEAKNSYSVRIETTDGAATFQKAFVVTITNVNEQPTDIALSNLTVDENQPAGTAVGTFSTVDPDTGDAHLYVLIAGAGDADNASFTISGNQLLTAGAFDLETKSSYSIRVRSTDSGSLTVDKEFTITVTNENEAPTGIALDNATLAENQAIGTPVGNLTSADPDAGDSHTYALVAGTGDTDNASFQISGGQLVTNVILDFESQSSYSVRIQTSDAGGLTYDEAFSITVIDANDAPTSIALDATTVAENEPADTVVGNLTVSDPDAGDTHTFALASGTGDTDNASFKIVGTQLLTNASLDFESQSSYSIRIAVTDSGTASFEDEFTITATDAPEAPTDIALSANSVAENSVSGTAVGTFSSVDQDAGATHTYALISGTGDADNASFAIVGNQLQTAAVFDFEAKNSYSILVQSTDDDGLVYAEALVIGVTDVNEAPNLDDAVVSIDENSANGTAVGSALPFTDPDAGQTHTFAITGGDAGGVFAISNTGQITVANSTLLNHEATQSFSLTVQVTDNGAPALSDTASVTISVNDVNEAPTAGTDAYLYIANTELRVGGHAGNPAAVASTSVATNLLANDTDPDTLNPAFANLSITTVINGASANGGVYSINADGTMVYTPPAGSTDADSVTYSLTDGTNVVNGTINLTRDGTDRVWYVKNNAPAGGTGTSTAPFDTLLEAQTASAANDIVYVLPGDGTTNGQNAGFTLKDNQKLWGNGVALLVDLTTGPDLELIAADTEPQIGNASGVGVSATNLTGDVQVLGLNIGASTNAVGVSTNATGTTVIADNTIRNAGAVGISYATTGGTAVLAVHDNAITASGNALVINRSGTGSLTITAFDDNTISGNTGGSGVIVTNARFDATPGGGINVVPAGNWAIGDAVNPVGGMGMSLSSVNGALAFNDLDIFADGGGALTADGDAVGALTLSVLSGVSTLHSNSGPAAEISDTALTLDNALVTSYNSANGGANGVSLTRVTGSFSATSSSTIRNATNAAFAMSASSAAVTYAGSIYDDTGVLVAIADSVSGTKIFSGPIDDLDASGDPIGGGGPWNGGGIVLTNNGTAVIRFTGGVQLSTGTTAAFTATGGGTVEVCDETPCNAAATGGVVNRVTTTTGTALHVANTTIGAGHLEFQSINVNGAVNAMVLSNTGAGGLKVVGTGTTDGSGGTIQNIGGRGGSFTSAAQITLKNMNFSNVALSAGGPCGSAAIAGANGGCSAALHFDTVSTVVLDNLNLTGSGQQGINAINLTGLTLSNSVLTNLGNGPDEDGLHFHNLLGTNTITNTSITSSGDDNVNIQNLSGTSTITITGGSFNTGVLGSGLLFGIRGSSNTTLNITNVTADDNFSGGIVADAFDTATMRVTIDNATLTNNNDGVAMSSANGSTRFAVKNSTFTGNDFLAVSLLKAAYSTGGVFEGQVDNNEIVIANGRTADAIAVFQAGGGSLVPLITNNDIDYAGTQRAILIQAGQDGSGVLEATVTNNTVDIALDGIGNAVAGVLAQSAITGPGNTSSLCLDFGGAGSANVFTHSLGGAIPAGDLRLRQRNDGTVRLPGYVGSATDLAAVVSYLAGRNAFVSPPTVTQDDPTPGYLGGPACTQPNLP